MTREEARDQIVIFMCDEQKVINDRDKQALEMAIKALEQEPTETWSIKDVADTLERHGLITEQEPSGDLINRQAVMDCFKKWQPYMATRLWDFEQELSKLPSVSPQPCEDAISRQAVHEAITRWAGSMSVLIALPTREVRPLLESIHKLPSVKPQEKTGHWKLQPSNKEQGERDFIWWKCSKCGQVIFSETEKDRREYHAFCGRCGARMVDEQERSDKE